MKYAQYTLGVRKTYALNATLMIECLVMNIARREMPNGWLALVGLRGGRNLIYGRGWVTTLEGSGKLNSVNRISGLRLLFQV